MNLPETDVEIKNVETESDNNSYEKNTAFFPVSEGKLITLYILSFGLYGVYWFYKNWSLQQGAMEKKIYPMWRAIFSIFFTHSLFNRIHQQAAHLKNEHKFNANLWATIFVAAIVVSNILDRLSINTGLMENTTNTATSIISFALFFVSTYPLVKVQATVNRINNDILGYLNHKYSMWNYVLIVLGSVVWLLMAMGFLAESMGLVVAE